MHSRLLSDGPDRSFIVVFEVGEEAMDGLAAFAEANDVWSGTFVGIGALSEATLATYNPDTKAYDEIPVTDQTELLNVTGHLTMGVDGQGRLVHAHAVLCRPDGSTIGGHVVRAVVRPTLELRVQAAAPQLSRRYDEATGLNLIDFSQANDR